MQEESCRDSWKEIHEAEDRWSPAQKRGRSQARFYHLGPWEAKPKMNVRYQIATPSLLALELLQRYRFGKGKSLTFG